MLPIFRLSIASLSAGLLTTSAAFAQFPGAVPNADPPRTTVEDVRERYRASRAAEKPHAETPADSVEVGEGDGLRRIEPVDPTLDPSSDVFAPPGGSQDPTLVHGSLPVGFDRLELAGPVQSEMFVIVKDFDARMNDVLARHAAVHSRLVMLEAAADAEPKAAIVTSSSRQRVTGYRPDGTAIVEPPAVVVTEIPSDSPYAAAAAEARNELAALHRKAVRLESDKLVALQKKLTPDQIRVVREYRLQPVPVATPAREQTRPVAPPQGTVIDRDVDVERDGVEIEERRVTPQGRKVDVEIESPRLEIERD